MSATPMHPRADYGPFAEVYDRHWGGFADRILPILDRLVPGQIAAGARVLDLCCGTGQLAAAMTDRGCEVIGVDVSESMVELAMRNASAAEFMVVDARSFILPHPVDVAVSTFDSLNHIMDLSGLTRVFRNVRASLVKGGSFVFDLNVEEGYLARWGGSFGISTDTEVVVVRSTYDSSERIGTMQLTVMTPSNQQWRRTDVTLTQRCYDETDVVDALEEAGFEEISVVTAAEVDWAEVGRSLFAAR